MKLGLSTILFIAATSSLPAYALENVGQIGLPAFAGDSGSQDGPGSVCATYTTCADGHQINCQAAGNSCKWSYQEGASVSCTGYDGSNFTGLAHTSQMTCN